MAVEKWRVFENISTNSASNDKVTVRYSISSFLQVFTPGVCFLFSRELFFQFFTGEKCIAM